MAMMALQVPDRYSIEKSTGRRIFAHEASGPNA